MVEETYLGDGVYAKVTDFHVELKLGVHRSATVIYLEDGVLENLFRHLKHNYPDRLCNILERIQLKGN